MENAQPRATGRCLCGAVTYEVRGPLRDIVLCHCVECRRWSGAGAGAFAAAHDGDLVITGYALRGIAAGTLDAPTGLRVAAHIYTHQAVDWAALLDDGLPRDPETGAFEIRWT